MDARYAEDYEGRLREAIQEMRAENDAVVHAVKEEAEEYIAKKVRLTCAVSSHVIASLVNK